VVATAVAGWEELEALTRYPMYTGVSLVFAVALATAGAVLRPWLTAAALAGVVVVWAVSAPASPGRAHGPDLGPQLVHTQTLCRQGETHPALTMAPDWGPVPIACAWLG